MARSTECSSVIAVHSVELAVNAKSSCLWFTDADNVVNLAVIQVFLNVQRYINPRFTYLIYLLRVGTQ